MKKIIIYATLTSLVLAASCSKSGGGGSKAVEKNTTEPLETELNGAYQAILAPLNKDVSGHLNGSLTLVREKDEMVIDVRLANGPASVLHSQSIHIGSRCPSEVDDLNGDGLIDGEEATNAYQEIIVPLDDDISSQRMGLGIFPVTDQYGNYFWSRSVSYEKFMNDLREEDINLTDDYVKLSENKSLSMVGKIVIIKGVPDTTNLPDTVSGRGRENKFQALPIACGVIKRLGPVPGKIDNDFTGIAVPEGETVGGSSGADDGAIFTSTDSTGNTGNYGEEEGPETTTNNTEWGTTGGNY